MNLYWSIEKYISIDWKIRILRNVHPHSSLFLDIKYRIIFVPYARATHNLVIAYWIFENLVPKFFYEPSKMTHFSEIFVVIEIFNFLKSILGHFPMPQDIFESAIR